MPKIKPIVNAINEHLKSVALADACFTGTKFSGITEAINKRSTDMAETVPCETTNDGEGFPIYPDDSFPLQIYHKILGSVIRVNPNLQYGRTEDVLTRTVSLSMVAISQRAKTKLSAEELDLLLLYGMPYGLDKQSIKNLNLKSCNINVLGTDFDSQAIYSREWPSAGKPLSPDLVILEIKYQIGCTFNRKCINPLCC